MIDKGIQRAMDQEAANFALFLGDKIKSLFSAKRFTASGKLAQSVQVTYTKSTDSQLPVITLQYAIQGKFIDIKKMYWAHQPDVVKLIAWLQTGGKIGRFTNVPGYKNSSPTSQFKAVERVAWAIAMDKRKNDTWKAKAWKGKNLREALKVLNEETTKIWADYTAKRIADAIAGNLQIAA